MPKHLCDSRSLDMENQSVPPELLRETVACLREATGRRGKGSLCVCFLHQQEGVPRAIFSE